IKRSLQGARIGNSKNRVRLPDIVGNAQARLRLRGGGEPVVKVAPDTQIERPVALRNGVLNIHRQLFHVGMSKEGIQGTVRTLAPRRLCRNRPSQVVTAQQRRVTGVGLKSDGSAL